MENPESYIEYSHWDQKIRFTRANSDLTYAEFMDEVEKLIFAVGYNQKHLEEYIIEWGEELKGKHEKNSCHN